MATGIKRLLDQVSDPSTKAAYSELCFKNAKDAAQKASALAPYTVTDVEASSLERLGITTSPFATISHTHSADKIIENDCLAYIGHYLNKDPVTFIQLKRSKLQFLKRGPDQDFLANYCHEPKDVLRYGITNPHHCPTVNTPVAVLSDTLHFMTPLQLINLFLRNPSLQTLFATLVLPVEALHKLPSLYPEIYRLEYFQNHFAYMPGGHGGASYVHSYGTLKWLSTGQVGAVTNYASQTITTDYLSIEKLETKAAHHIMLIQRRQAHFGWPLAPLWVFQASDYVKLPHIFYPPEANVQNTYPHLLIKRMQTYCFSVKAVSLRDIFAKLRQVIETKDLVRYSMADLIRLANYLLFTTGLQQVSDYESFITKGCFAKLCARIRMRLRTLTEPFTGQTAYTALLSVSDVIPVPFTTSPRAYPAQGADWYSGHSEANPEPKPEGAPPAEQPTPDDLDLLEQLAAEMREVKARTAAGAQKTTSEDNTPPGSKKSSTFEVGSTSSAKTSLSQGESGSDVDPRTDPLFRDEEDEQSLLRSCNKLTIPGVTQSNASSPKTQKAVQTEPHADLNRKGKEVVSETPPDVRQAVSDVHDITALLGLTDQQLLDPSCNDESVESSTPESPPDATSKPLLEEAMSFGERMLQKMGHKEGLGLGKLHQGITEPIVATGGHGAAGLGFHDKDDDPSMHDSPTRRILSLHGFTSHDVQFDGENIIQPVFWNPNIASKTHIPVPTNEVQRAFISMASSIERRFYKYTIDNHRATAYLSDVKNNLTGLVLPKLSRDTLSAWVSLGENSARDVKLLVIHGAGGAGKSRALQETLRGLGDLNNEVNVIVPTVNLVMDWRKKLNAMATKRFITFEKACEREGREVVIFDDYGKLPAGYIDAYLAIKPTVDMVILTGDQRQSVHYATNRDCQIAGLPTNVDHFKPYCDYYINATHRQPRRLANPIKVHAERQLGGSVTRASLIPEKATTLVPSHRSQTTLNDLGRTALTYAGCQGLTLPNVTIILDNDTPSCSPEVLYTAFSRASETITFVNTHSDNPEFLAKLDATPYLKTLLSGVREDENYGRDVAATEAIVREPSIKTHLPVANDNTMLEPKIENVMDKDVRELWDGHAKTNLMQTEDPIIQLFPHQQAKDEALFKLTIEQRIKQASPEENMKELTASLRTGDLLFEAYADFMKVPKEAQAFNPALWEHCKQLALRTYLSKPKNNLVQGATRQDPDFPNNAIALFNKSQWVKKLEKVGFAFKAGQTISAFKQETVLLTTTLALYLRKKREEHQPDNVFIMCERTPEQFNDFVVNRWDFTRASYTSDYTQYDQSQDAAFLNFELRKAAHYGVPDEVLKFYRFIKTNAKTFVGNLAVMRLSGEGPTFDANTECNIAYDALRFQLDNTVNACYAGDDLVRDKVCHERSCWRYCQGQFQLQAKPLETWKPDFCGWRLTKYGIVKSPIQLYQSLQLALRLGRIDEVKRSYAIDYLYAYRLGDKLYDIFSEEELETHQLVTRALIKRGMEAPSSGDRLPCFHITSDRLIRNPHAKEMHDSSSDRLLLQPIVFNEEHMLPEH